MLCSCSLCFGGDGERKQPVQQPVRPKDVVSMGACAGLCLLQTRWSPAVTVPCRARLASPRAWPKIHGYFTQLTCCWREDGEEDALLKSTLPIGDVQKLTKGSNTVSRMTFADSGGHQTETCFPLGRSSARALPSCSSDAARPHVPPGWGASSWARGIPCNRLLCGTSKMSLYQGFKHP